MGHRCFYLTYPYGVDGANNFDFSAEVAYFPEKGCQSAANATFYHDNLKNRRIETVINQDGFNAHSRLFLDTGETTILRIAVLHNDPLGTYP